MRQFIGVSGMAAISAALMLVLALVAGRPALAGGTAGAEACSSPRTVNHIVNRFAWAERHTWHRGYVISTLDRPRFRYNVFNGPTSIRHTHCAATAVMTNGSRRTVYYMIGEGMGFASVGPGVEFCVLGLDPWRVHDAGCRTVR